MHGLAWCLLACFLACCAVLCYAVQGWESGVSWGDQLVDCGRWAVGVCVCVGDRFAVSAVWNCGGVGFG